MAEMGFKTAADKAPLRRKALESAIKVAWWARNGTGKEARKALREHMADLGRLFNGVTEFKDTELEKLLHEAFDDAV